MTLGPLMIDLEGLTLTTEEQQLLKHPLIGGVILFSRNYESPQQLIELTRQISEIRQPPLLISVDHEGGRVQRFRDQFSAIPAMAQLGKHYEHSPRQAIQWTEQIAWLLAIELRAAGVDFSFTPVLDINTLDAAGNSLSKVIGDRAFHSDPQVIVPLAQALIKGLKKAGMGSVGKHFPGHGSVEADSHHEIPIDKRTFKQIQTDLYPFKRLIQSGLTAIMPAHVIYEQIDQQPAGFSQYWMQTVLRQHLRFQGVIFSDDLCMAGACVIADISTRVRHALQAGCDMVLICNDRPTVLQAIDQCADLNLSPVSQARLIRLRGKGDIEWHELTKNYRWRQAQKVCQQLQDIEY
ncbi:beta-N-acetylhexosaminidase [Candidatus Albibeggiatoa sp. nov. NOAA]|uniref:beta-N-acetylhexosaminidase n=1 Tax=Candidatus Albibeggiatoa sp. nov. NOAA TaxID=3162724 RepID=UPI003304814B|nr:beta-N-acetylhexosaminidase [Thiotrichaceae bacterium]